MTLLFLGSVILMTDPVKLILDWVSVTQLVAMESFSLYVCFSN